MAAYQRVVALLRSESYFTDHSITDYFLNVMAASIGKIQRFPA
jgi:hypothetical protein